MVDIKKVESRGNALAQKQLQLIPCTMVLYDKGGTIQRAGCLVTGCQIKVASRSYSSRPMASPIRENKKKVVCNELCFNNTLIRENIYLEPYHRRQPGQQSYINLK